jgi:hypothetical protein
VQPLAAAGLIATRVAVTAPVDAVEPVAVAHSPTLRAELVAATVSVYVVVGVTVTVSVVVAAEPAAAELAPPAGRSVALTVIVDPLTAVTVPSTMPPKPRPPAKPPLGRAPLGRAPLGRSPLGRAPLERAPDGRVPPGPANPPPNPLRQLPPLGLLITTVVAVMLVGGALAVEAPVDPVDPVAEVDVASTHEPTVTAASVILSVAVNVVEPE